MRVVCLLSSRTVADQGSGYWNDIGNLLRSTCSLARSLRLLSASQGVEWWHTDPDWDTSDMGWPIVPWSLREILLFIQEPSSPRKTCKAQLRR